ncbi:hypothetical protein Pelo_10858 [Pelomyxa schiedti]|nr:hypothetical protein Pelo_10858 [Pelomyxa schiedti]
MGNVYCLDDDLDPSLTTVNTTQQTLCTEGNCKTCSVPRLAAYEVIPRHKALHNVFTNFVLDDLCHLEQDTRTQAVLCRKMWKECHRVGRGIADKSSFTEALSCTPPVKRLEMHNFEAMGRNVLCKIGLEYSHKRSELCAEMIFLCVQVFLSRTFIFWEEGSSLDPKVFPSQSLNETQVFVVDFYVLPGLHELSNDQRTTPVAFVKYVPENKLVSGVYDRVWKPQPFELGKLARVHGNGL